MTRPLGSGTTCACTNAAATIMHMLWRRKEVASVPRAFGFMSRVEAKQKQPHRKQAMLRRDLSQPSGWLVGWPEAPRARKIVLPGGEVVSQSESGDGVGGEARTNQFAWTRSTTRRCRRCCRRARRRDSMLL